MSKSVENRELNHDIEWLNRFKGFPELIRGIAEAARSNKDYEANVTLDERGLSVKQVEQTGWSNVEYLRSLVPGYEGVIGENNFNLRVINSCVVRVIGDVEIVVADNLVRREMGVLICLALLHDEVVPRQTLLDMLWNADGYDGGERTVDVHMHKLRKKMGSNHQGNGIFTGSPSCLDVISIRGVGYSLVDSIIP